MFPKHPNCAIEAFSAFLVQFLGGPPEDSQRRWFLSLRESHARFEIGVRERDAWLGLMNSTLDEFTADERVRRTLRGFFHQSATYLVGPDAGDAGGLTESWNGQVAADGAVAAIRRHDARRAIELAAQCSRAVLPGLLAQMIRARNRELLDFVSRKISEDPGLTHERYAGRTLLHEAAAAGCDEVVRVLLNFGADPNAADSGGHAPLYSAGNECQTPGGADVVRTLVEAGADVNSTGGVQRCTALHMAARRGNIEIAEALLECGAAIEARDKRGDTPLGRALNCRKRELAEFLIAKGAEPDSSDFLNNRFKHSRLT
jgi:hypothetical protein